MINSRIMPQTKLRNAIMEVRLGRFLLNLNLPFQLRFAMLLGSRERFIRESKQEYGLSLAQF